MNKLPQELEESLPKEIQLIRNFYFKEFKKEVKNECGPDS